MSKKLLSLALALTLCLSLAIPVLATDAPKGETKVVTDEDHGVVITMDGFLRVETHRYDTDGTYEEWTFYVLADNSHVTVEAMEGMKYATTEADKNAFYDDYNEYYKDIYNAPEEPYKNDTYAWSDLKSYTVSINPDGTCEINAQGLDPHVLTEPDNWFMKPFGVDDRFWIGEAYSIIFICESNFARLVPAGEDIIAADWTKETLWNAYDARLFYIGWRNDIFEMFETDFNQNITRRAFACMSVNLYTELDGSLENVDYNHPFTDLSTEIDIPGTVGWANVGGGDERLIGYAYNLGFIEGIDDTHFDPDSPLTREQAAVILGRVYAKLHEAIPEVTSTTFADDNAVSGWAKSGVAFMAAQGFVNGVGDNQFAPQRQLSMQEAIVIAYRMYEKLQ